jgi:hypothetical protein
VKQTGDAIRDTVVLTCRGDGLDLPVFFIYSKWAKASKSSGRKLMPGEPPVKGMTIQWMKHYINHIAQYIQKHSVLLMDRASSHTSKDTLRYIATKKLNDGTQMFTVKFFGPKAAFLVSPLDMGAIAKMKSTFYTLDRSTLAMKHRAVLAAWKSVSNDDLCAYFLNCGIIGEESIASIRDRFHKQIRSGIPPQFEEIWDFYDGWKSGSYQVEGISAIRGVPLEAPAQLLEGELDGGYWSNYGSYVG